MKFKTKLKQFRSSYFIIIPKKKVEALGLKLDDYLDIELKLSTPTSIEIYCKKCMTNFIIEEDDKRICPTCGNDKEKYLDSFAFEEEIPFREDLVEYRCLVCLHQFILNRDEEVYCPSCGTEAYLSIEKLDDNPLVSEKEVHDTYYKGGEK